MVVARLLAIGLLIQQTHAAVAIQKPEVDLPTECAMKEQTTFGWEDYMVVMVMLVGSCCIGLFYCLFDKKQVTSSDFLLGGGSMGTLPTALSLASGFITAIELLGNPAESYSHGTQFWMSCVSFFLVVPITSSLYLPVFMKLRLTSCYQYLELRFGSTSRTIASGLYILQMMMYTSVAVYAPALALSHVTGLNVYLAVTIVYIVCVFYASQGGMKAVIMTDTFQASVLLGSVICVLALGIKEEGGSLRVLDDSLHSERLEFFIMDPNPTVRHSFWSVVVGGTFYWATMFCSNQASIQKYLSVETISQARKALWVSAIGLSLVYTLNFFTGMIMYTAYKDCDPLTAGEIDGVDEMLPLYVMEALGKFKGVPGFFVAGIFCASLGTVAAALNSLSAVTMQDFVAGAWGLKIPDDAGATYAKWLSLFYGIISFALIFIVEQLGSVLQIALSFNGMIGGVTLGMFSLGMFVPWANTKGAISGAITALGFVMWIGIGALTADLQFERKEISIDNCPCLNATISGIPAAPSYEGFSLYEVSYLWYSAIGCMTTILVGTLVSLITGPEDPNSLDASLLSPPVANYLKQLANSGSKDELCLAKRNRVISLNGVTNFALDIKDEKPITGALVIPIH